MPDFAIALSNLDKTFRRFQHPGWRAMDALGWPVSKKRYDTFQALTDINLTISPGERVALIGRNGAGKSTLLRLITGQMRADRGTVCVNGQVQALMTLGTGFHPDFTGVQNIRSALACQGMAAGRIQGCIEEIADFTELDDFLLRPVKEYSAGMYARLAFAVATTLTPEILIIDEVLGAGDAYFMGKCIQRMKSLTSQGATIVFVSHDIASVQTLCDRGIWLDGGRIRQDGPLLPVSKAYLASVRDDEERRVKARSMSLTRQQAARLRPDDGRMTLMRLVGREGTPPRQPLTVRAARYGDAGGVLGQVPMDDLQSGGASCLLIDPQFMNWRVADSKQASTCWAFGDFGGRYLHAPLQIRWPDNAGLTGRWVELELCPSASDAVAFEQFDEQQQTYVSLAEIATDTAGRWQVVRVPVRACAEPDKPSIAPVLAELQALASEDRYGSGEVRMTGFGFFDAEGSRRHTLVTGEPASAVIAFEASQPVNDPVPVVAVYRPDGTCAMQVISRLSGTRFSCVEGKGAIRIAFSPLMLGPGDYLVSVAMFRELDLASSAEPAAYDLHDRCHALKVLAPPGIHVQIGTVNQPAQWELLA